jgi:hypothetical protein
MVTAVQLRQLVNDPAAEPYPDDPPDTIFAQDWNMLRQALTSGTQGIYTKGAKIGSDGLEFVASASIRLAAGVQLSFLDGGNSNVQVGYLSADGELGMKTIRTSTTLRLDAGVTIRHDGLTTHTVPIGITTNTHEKWTRGAVTVKDFEVDYNTGVLSVLHILTGNYAVDKDNAGFIFKNPSVRTILRMNDAGELEVADVDDWAARPLTFSNIRTVMLGTGVFVDDIIGVDGVVATVINANPKRYEISLSGVQAPVLDIGLGPDQIGPDTLASGGLIGSIAAFVTPAEKTLITTLQGQVAAILAELPAFVKKLHTAAGMDIVPDVNGRILLANSSSVIFDMPGPNTLRAVASGGGGGGSVDSVTAGDGLGDIGTATDPNLKVNPGDGIILVTDQVTVDFAGSGVATTVARSDHDHSGVYSPVGHTHAGFIPTGGAYADLFAAGKIGTVAGKVAAGDDSRFHTQNTDTGTSNLTFTLRAGYAGTPGAGDIVGILVERGTQTDARIYFRESDDKWVAGLVGSEELIVLDSDARLTNARTPTAHALDGVLHTGQLDSARVVVTTFMPVEYVPLSPNVDGHLAGIDGALSGFVAAGDPGLGGQQFMGAAGTITGPGTYLIGSAGLGEINNKTGVISAVYVNSEFALAGGTSITIEVKNITTAVSNSIVLNDGDTFARNLAFGLIVNAGDEISAKASIVVGLPAAGVVTVRMSRS